MHAFSNGLKVWGESEVTTNDESGREITAQTAASTGNQEQCFHPD